jgi:hypothetical protein
MSAIDGRSGAAAAAAILNASIACAIHHGLFHNPPNYVEQPNAIARFLAAAARRGIRAVAPPDGDVVEPGAKGQRRMSGP